MPLVVGKLTGFEYEHVKVKADEKEEYKNNTYSLGLFPYLQDSASGDGFGESLAIARFMCNSTVKLYGSTAYETAKVDEVLERHLAALNQSFMKVLPATLGYMKAKEANFKDGMKKIKDYIRTLDEEIKDKEYFVGDSLTLADVYLVVTINFFIATILDAGFRKAVPNFMKWYEKVRGHEAIEAHLGKQRYIGKPMKPLLQE